MEKEVPVSRYLTDKALKSANLTPEEENVLRMRYGIPLEPGTALNHSTDPEVLRLEALLVRKLVMKH